MIEFLVEVDKEIYEISELISRVSYADALNDGCSKLEFSYIDDSLKIKNGSVVRFKFNDVNIFYGYVFKHGQNNKKEIAVTAYDQLRYCKAKDTITAKGDTITTLAKKMCNYFNLKTATLTETRFVLPISLESDKTWLDIMYSAISDTFMNTGRKYALRDEFGGISIRDLKELQLDLVLGDESLAYDFKYEKSIDEDFYNQIKLASDNEKTGNIDAYTVMDSNSIKKYGLLQYFEKLDKNKNSSQVKSKAEKLLGLYNREAEKLDLNCLGDTSIRAGSSFYAQISDIELKRRLIVKSVTHEFLPIHTMSLELMI